jgi:hypothetical protein
MIWANERHTIGELIVKGLLPNVGNGGPRPRGVPA